MENCARIAESCARVASSFFCFFHPPICCECPNLEKHSNFKVMEIKLAYPALKKAATSRVIALPQLNRCQRRTNIYDHTVESQNKSMHAMLYLKEGSYQNEDRFEILPWFPSTLQGSCRKGCSSFGVFRSFLKNGLMLLRGPAMLILVKILKNLRHAGVMPAIPQR